TPLAGADGKLEAIWQRLAHGASQPRTIEILGRPLRCRRHVPGAIWFDFRELCGGPRAQTDYVELAREYHTVFLSDIPPLGSHQASEARRLTWLVDVFYDSRVKLVISAEVEADLLYTEGVQASEFFRTASRLTEMQSSAYLALAHRLAEESEPAA
ncbi:cell division protein ZapE, partial [Laribacter hongkongensis]